MGESIMSENKSFFGKVVDGFSNLVSRLGAGQEQDNQLSNSNYTFNLISRNRVLLEAMYRGSWIVGKVVDAVAKDMTRAGITITSTDSPADIEEMNKAITRLQIMNSVQDVVRWSRLYGGAIGVMMIDGQDLESPLDMKRIQKGQFSGISVFDRWQLWPDLTNVIRNGPDIGLPAYYTIIGAPDIMRAMSGDEKGSFDLSAAAQAGGLRVHHSRIIRMVGVKLPYYQSITEMMWGMSEVERLYDRLVSFDSATMSSANLINHANLRTVKIKDLREIVSSGSKAAVEGLYSQFDMMRYAQSNEGLTLLDAEDEFASTAYSFAGLSDMMLQFGQQLSGASGIPLVIMFGQSPAGLNSTGESDVRMYYDNINAQQESTLRRPFDKLLKVIYMSEFGKPAPKDMQFSFTPLWQMSATEKATNGKSIAETVAGAFEANLINKFIALKELRQAAPETGLFSNITDEDIAEAELEKNDEPPMPDDDPASSNKNIGGASNVEPGDIDPSASLNGAQVTSMLSIVNQVSVGTLPRDTAIKMMAAAFPISESDASNILGKVGKGFIPAELPAKVNTK
jgi:phage-related protein (TIGR01555 family)